MSLEPLRGGHVTHVALSPVWSGANRGHQRDDNWTHLPLLSDRIRLPADGGQPIAVARGPLPPGHYDRVFVAASAVDAYDPAGQAEPLLSHIEPIARGFDLDPEGACASTSR